MLHRHAEDLWTVDYELSLAPGLPFPTRMTVVRLADGTLALISPVPIDDALSAELATLGPVSHLVAPKGVAFVSSNGTSIGSSWLTAMSSTWALKHD